MTLDDTSRARCPKHVFAREFDGELVLLDLAKGEYYGLDPLGARTWNGLVGGRSIAEIANELVADYDVDLNTLRADLVKLLGELAGKGLVEIIVV
jgi:hypothetical protein